MIALDEACSFFGQGAARSLAPPEPPKAPPGKLTLRTLQDIRESHFADDLEIDFETMRHWSYALVRSRRAGIGHSSPPPVHSCIPPAPWCPQAEAYFANDGVMPPLTTTAAPSTAQRKSSTHDDASVTAPPRLLLPFVVGLPQLARAGNWAALRAAALRSGVRDCAHAFCAVGLPPESVATVLTANRWALRSTLGSANAHKLGSTKLNEWRARRERRARHDG